MPDKKDFLNTLFRLIIPTIVFSSIIYIPKILFHSRSLSFGDFIYDIFGGISFWFTSALAVSQIILLLIVKSGAHKLRYYVLLSLAIICVMPVLKHFSTTPFPWYWKSGLAAIPFMVLGGIIPKFQKLFTLNYRILSLSISILFAIAVFYEIYVGEAHFALMSVTFNLPGILVTLSGIVFIFVISRYLIPDIKFLQFIGNNSIIFYFLSGVIPASLSSLQLPMMTHNAFATLTLSAIAIAIGYSLTWIIVHYLPFLTDFRKLLK